MSIHRRERSAYWWVAITTPSGKRIRKSTGTTDRKAAQEYHDKLKAELWAQARIGVKPVRRWEEAALKYLKEKEGKKSIDDDARHVAWWTEQYLGRELKSITRAESAALIEAAQDHPATRNRYIATLRAVMRMAHREYGWLDVAPAFKTYKEPDGRIRWLTHEEATRLIAELPEYLRDMAEFSLATGLRQANMTGLTWDRVDMVRRSAFIPASMFKGGKDYTLPLNNMAIDVIRRRLGKHSTHVFLDKFERPVEVWQNTVRRDYEQALSRAGIDDFHWHDLRHTWATWHVHAGTDIYTLKDLGGWKSIQMPMRYAHLSIGFLAEAAQRVTLLTHSVEMTEKKKATEVA